MKKMLIAICLYTIALITLTVKIPFFFVEENRMASSMIVGIYIICLVVTWVVYRNQLPKMYDVSQLKKGTWYMWLIIGVLLSLIIQFLNGLALTLLGVEIPFNNDSIYDWMESYVYIMILPLLAAPLFEELIFRELIFKSTFKKTNSFFLAGLISSVLFVCVHFSLMSAVAYFFIGILFGYLYKKGGVMLTTSVHVLTNAAIFIFFYINT